MKYVPQRNSRRPRTRTLLVRPSLVAGTASAVLFMSLSPLPASASGISTSTAVSDVPYSLPVTNLPTTTQSPPVAADAPYTPAVLNLIAQLEPSNPPTLAELTNADMMFYGGTNNTCYNVGPVGSPTLTGTATVPSIIPMCWTDAQGVNVTSGPNDGKTTGPMDLMGLGATFDRTMANVWGQTEGTEARELMVTGLFGPQTDIDRMPTWGRNLTTTGADPYLSGQMVAAQINGIQGSGAMSQMKHFAAYNGEDTGNGGAEVQDQALHEIYLTPYEAGFVYGGAAATMCSYQLWQDTATTLPASVPTLASTYPVSPYGTSAQQTWPLDESHQSCEQPLTLTYALTRPVGVKGDGRVRLRRRVQHRGDQPGRGPGDAVRRWFQRLERPRCGRLQHRGDDGRPDRRHVRRRQRQRRSPAALQARTTSPGSPGRAAPRPPGAPWSRPWPTALSPCRCSTRTWRLSCTRSSASGCLAATSRLCWRPAPTRAVWGLTGPARRLYQTAPLRRPPRPPTWALRRATKPW